MIPKNFANKKSANLYGIDKNILKILNNNPEGLRARTIKNLLNIKQRTLYDHLKKLEKKELILNLYPIWKIRKVQTSREFMQTPLRSNREQGHKLTFVLPLVKKPDWWNKRKDRLIKLKGWHFKSEITANNNIYHQINNDYMQIQTYKNSIYFICKKRYYADYPIEVFTQAIEDVLEAIRFLEDRFRFKFLLEGHEHLTVISNDFVTIRDELSKICKKENNRFRIKSKEGYSLWVDFSEPLGTESDNPEIKRRFLRHYKDIIDNPDIPTNSELSSYMKDLMITNKDMLNTQKMHQNQYDEVLGVLGMLKEQIASHLTLIKEYRNEAELRNKEYQAFMEERKKPILRQILDKFK